MGKLGSLLPKASQILPLIKTASNPTKPSSSFPSKQSKPNHSSSPLVSGETYNHHRISVKTPPGNDEKKKKKCETTIFKSGNLSQAQKLYDSLLSRCRSPVARDFHNALLADFTRTSTFDTSLQFLDHMKVKSGFSPDRATFHILLAQSAQAGQLPELRRALDLMTVQGFPPEHATVDIAVRALCSADNAEGAIVIFKEFSSSSSSVPDSFTYNFLVRHLCKSRAVSSAYRFIDEMREFKFNPDLVTYTILIDSVCKSKNLREALRLLDVLRECGFKPDCYLYNTIMKAYCIVDRGNEVVGVYNRMKEQGIQSDLITYNTMIFGLSKAGRIEQARKYLGIMVYEGHSPDTVTYTALMNGMCRKGDPMGAVGLLEDMEKEGCIPNSCTYNTLLQGLSKGRYLENCIKLYEIMKLDAVKIEAAAYACMMRLLCRTERVAEAYDVFDYALSSKSLTEDAAYTVLEISLNALRKTKD